MIKEKPIALGDKINLEIVGISHQGWGIGRYEGFTVFVPESLPGEMIKANVKQMKKTYAIGEIESIINASPFRAEPSCLAYASCGGCQMQHAIYENQLHLKEKIVQAALTKIGHLKDVQLHPILGMKNPWHYRNRIQLHLRYDADKVEIGFFRPGTHDLVCFEECWLVPDVFNQLKSFIESRLNQYLRMEDIPQLKDNAKDDLKNNLRNTLKHIVLKISFTTDEIGVVFITTKKDVNLLSDLAESLAERFPQVKSVVQNIQDKPSAALFGPKWKLILGKERLEEKIEDVLFSISPGSFIQVNPEQAKALYHKILDFAHLKGSETVVDLYCGIGTISLLLAKKAGRVIGIEEFQPAVDDGEYNAGINKFKNVEFIAGKAETIFPKMTASNIKPDLIVLDPPRKGCDPAVLEAIVQMKPGKVIYVSCDPATLARDLKILAEKGYRTVEVQPIDMFPHTAGVESIAKLIPDSENNENSENSEKLDKGDIRPMKVDELKDFYQYIKRDFKKGEYPPFDILAEQLNQGIQEGMVFNEGGEDLAYAIVSGKNGNGYVLVSLFAVLPKMRSGGIGSKFLKRLKERYKGKQGIIVEVECPDISLGQEEYDIRRRRIKFYEKNDFNLVPGVSYSIWDIPMDLMVLSILAAQETINAEIEQIMTDIYAKLLIPRYSHKMKVGRIEG